MNTLVPRRLADLADWFDEGMRFGNERMIRIEDKITDTEYELRAELPGLDPAKDVEVTVDEGVLNIHAERREEIKANGRSEFRYGALDRSVRLPATADPDKVTARYADGLLTVTVPLADRPTRARKIAVTNAAKAPEVGAGKSGNEAKATGKK